ncbi:MAG: nitroreductase family deazaflavin-dependent oxidoreductase [Chloroflexi bacterium]|nr:nitroreductase family deazaflavin-dependent oxidoreductase [Chloroflexota bacterium]
MAALHKKPGPLLRLFFRIPVWLEKIGLGGWERLIGAQWMLITTAGRKTGRPRHVMVDIMAYDRVTDTYYIEAAYGVHADWYRNIQSQPVIEASVGRRKFRARANIFAAENAGEMLVRFYRQKPAYTRSVMAFAGMKFSNEDELRALGKNLLLLAVQPKNA